MDYISLQLNDHFFFIAYSDIWWLFRNAIYNAQTRTLYCYVCLYESTEIFNDTLNTLTIIPIEMFTLKFIRSEKCMVPVRFYFIFSTIWNKSFHMKFVWKTIPRSFQNKTNKQMDFKIKTSFEMWFLNIYLIEKQIK